MEFTAPSIDWLAVAQAPPLALGEVHVWELPMDATDDAVRLHANRLSADEQRQAFRFVRPELTRRFVMRRSLLRAVLAQYVSATVSSLEFGWNNFGKPYLKGDRGDTVLFNTSQSHEVALLAVCRECEIGVDVEHIRPVSDFVHLGRRFFTSLEQQEIVSRPASQQLPAFFWIWTGKEAILKACGIGISTGLRRASIGIQSVGPQLVFLDDDLGIAGNWRLRGFVPRQDYLATLATDVSITQARYLRFQA